MRLRLPIALVCVLLMFLCRLQAQEAAAPDMVLYTTAGSSFSTTTSTDSLLTLKEVTINGARRTRKSTIIREFPFRVNESYPLKEIAEKLEQTKRQLMNTGLFRSVVVYLRSQMGTDVFVNVDVEEKWYFFPQPFIRVANGSFSQWNERGRPLDHLNYGIKLTQFNFSGRADRMHMNFTNGYTKKVALQYQGFYFDKALKWSGSISLAYGKNRELNYTTENNKLLAVKNPDGYLYEFKQASFDVSYRPAIKTRHGFSLGYHSNRVADTVSKLNNNYSAENNYSFPYLSYGVSFTDLDFNPYPTRGRAGEVILYKGGINSSINVWQLSVKGTNFWPVAKKSYFSIRAGGMLRLPFKQPYIMQQWLGYGDAFLQGYENYIVDGVAGGYAKATIGRNIFKTQIPMPQSKWLKSLRSIPLQMYVKAYGNAGYAHNPNLTLYNRLNNKMLYSSGVGIDIIAFADVIFKIEWSFNQLGQNGLYLHQ